MNERLHRVGKKGPASSLPPAGVQAPDAIGHAPRTRPRPPNSTTPQDRGACSAPGSGLNWHKPFSRTWGGESGRECLPRKEWTLPFPSLRDALRRRLLCECELWHRCRLVLPDLPPAAWTPPPSAVLVPASPVTWARKWRPPEGAASVAVGELKVAAVRAGGLGGLVLPERVWAFRRQGARCVAWARRAGTVGGGRLVGRSRL